MAGQFDLSRPPLTLGKARIDLIRCDSRHGQLVELAGYKSRLRQRRSKYSTVDRAKPSAENWQLLTNEGCIIDPAVVWRRNIARGKCACRSTRSRLEPLLHGCESTSPLPSKRDVSRMLAILLKICTVWIGLAR